MPANKKLIIQVYNQKQALQVQGSLFCDSLVKFWSLWSLGFAGSAPTMVGYSFRDNRNRRQIPK